MTKTPGPHSHLQPLCQQKKGGGEEGGGNQSSFTAVMCQGAHKTLN